MLDDETSKRKRSTHKKWLLVVSLIDIIRRKIMNTIKKKKCTIYSRNLSDDASKDQQLFLSCGSFLIGGWTTII